MVKDVQYHQTIPAMQSIVVPGIAAREGSELYQSVLRAVLYAVMELVKNMDSGEVLTHLMLNIPNYYGDMTQRELAVDLAGYLAARFETLRPEEASAARVLRELVKNQRLG